MKINSFLSAAVFGLICAGLVALMMPVLVIVVGAKLAMVLGWAGFSLLYIILLWRAYKPKFGLALTLLGWFMVVVLCLVTEISLTLIVVSFTLFCCLLRCLLRYRRWFWVVGDGVISMFSMSVGWLAFLHSSSMFLGLWSFLLVQSLVFLLPEKAIKAGQLRGHDGFEKAHRIAQQSLRRFANHTI